MAYEYKILEPMDYGHPGAGKRFTELETELAKLSKEGWEVHEVVPSMMRGRKVSGGREDTISMTTVAMIAILRRKLD
ncbi:DUF4177 domain-containing protein [bacterium]|nr:DUF4177 domain-containing protein [bacterium]